MTINERMKELREQLHLSQAYVAKYLGVSRSTVTQMENGNRKILAEEVSRLCCLFCVSADTLINGEETSLPTAFFVSQFEKLDERDQEEIMNLIRFKAQRQLQTSS